MARLCLSCGHDYAAAGGSFCESCRLRLVKSGFVELALPGELTARGTFTPYLELTPAERARAVACEREPDLVLYPRDVLELERMLADAMRKVRELQGEPDLVQQLRELDGE